MKGYCPECKRNVQGIKKKFTLGSFLLTGGVGRLLTDKNKCPICYSQIVKQKGDVVKNPFVESAENTKQALNNIKNFLKHKKN